MPARALAAALALSLLIFLAIHIPGAAWAWAWAAAIASVLLGCVYVILSLLGMVLLKLDILDEDRYLRTFFIVGALTGPALVGYLYLITK